MAFSCGGVVVDARNHGNAGHLSPLTSRNSFSFHGETFLELLHEKRCVDFTAHFTAKSLGELLCDQKYIQTDLNSSRNILLLIQIQMQVGSLFRSNCHSVSVLLLMWCSDYSVNTDTECDGELIKFSQAEMYPV